MIHASEKMIRIDELTLYVVKITYRVELKFATLFLFHPVLSPFFLLYNKLTPMRLEELLQNKKGLRLLVIYHLKTTILLLCQFINVDIAILSLESFRVTESDE